MLKPFNAMASCGGVMALWMTAFILSCRLSSTEAVGTGSASSSVAAMIFGEARQAIGQHFYATADQYFHRGVPHVTHRAFDHGFFMDLQRSVAPEEHLHLHGESVKEMLPWLWLTLRMDPQNVEAFRVAAFWLVSVGDLNAAQQVLREAQQNNPYHYQIKLDQARLLLRRGNTDRAARSFDAALRFLPRTEGIDPEEKNLDYGEIAMFRALLYETAGQPNAAIALYEKILQLFPNRTVLAERVKRLRAGQPPPDTAQSLLDKVLHSHDKHTCEQDDAPPGGKEQNHGDHSH